MEAEEGDDGDMTTVLGILTDNMVPGIARGGGGRVRLLCEVRGDGEDVGEMGER